MPDATAWDLLVRRDDIASAQLRAVEAPPLGPGQVLLRVDRVGMTANNVTYALMGEAMRYWDFFPAPDGFGRVPLWGFADVAASNADEVEVGSRFYGYLPPSSHLVVEPARADAFGFRDASTHRAHLPTPYNVYQAVVTDPAYDAVNEDLQILFRPLFITSFMLDDFLADNDDFGAEQLVLSSASSKTAYGAAFCARLRPVPPRLVGLTSERNRAFTGSLGCYDEVWTYDQLEEHPSDRPTAYVDMAGDLDVRRRMHAHFDETLRYDAVVGATHLDGTPAPGAGDVPGPRPTFFFAPDQIQKRRADWGPRGVETRFRDAWTAFVPTVRAWVDVTVGSGPDALREAWLDVRSGASDPRRGHIIQL